MMMVGPSRGGSRVIDYTATFSLPARPEEVWDRIERFEQYETWWGWLDSFRAEREGLVDGNVLEGVVAPPLPFRLNVQVRLDRCDRPHHVDASVDGDIRGRASLSLEGSGAGTRAAVRWSLAMVRGPVRTAAFVAYPFVRWGHDRVVEMTVRGFRRRALADVEAGQRNAG